MSGADEGWLKKAALHLTEAGKKLDNVGSPDAHHHAHHKQHKHHNDEYHNAARPLSKVARDLLRPPPTWQPGVRPLKKLVIGDEAAKYLPVAMNKLAELYRNPAKILSTNVIVDGVSIRVQKLDALDVITIQGGTGWMAVSYAINNPYAYQLARASGPNSTWVEKPQPDDTTANEQIAQNIANASAGGQLGPGDFYIDNNLALFSGVLPTRSGNRGVILTTGDKRYGFLFAGEEFGFYKLNNDTYLNVVQVDEPVINANNVVRPTSFPFPEDVSPYVNPYYSPVWLKNPHRYNDITLQMVVTSISKLDFQAFTPRFSLIDVDYPEFFAISNQGLPYYKTLVDTPLPSARYNDEQASQVRIPNPCFLTPDHVLMSQLTKSNQFYVDLGAEDFQGNPIPTGFYIHALAYSVDGGSSFGIVEGGALQLEYYPPTITDASLDTWAPLNASEALWCWKRVVGTDIVWTIVSFSTSGLIVHMRDFEAYSATSGVDQVRIFSLGQNCVLAALNVHHADESQTLYFTRSYDGGVTWDEPNDSGFLYFAQFVGYEIPVGASYQQAGCLYPYKPYTSNEDPGAVYLPVTSGTRYDAASGLDAGENLRTVLMKSTDQCRTWQQTSVISAGKLQPVVPGFAQNLITYQEVVDLTAPIDPIFPWRVDARVTPPDWWMV